MTQSNNVHNPQKNCYVITKQDVCTLTHFVDHSYLGYPFFCLNRKQDVSIMAEHKQSLNFFLTAPLKGFLLQKSNNKC